jgi:hypothetical protein
MSENKTIINGWISPEGKIYECDEMHHMDVAYDIAVDKKFILPKDDISYKDMIHKYKFIKFFNPNSSQIQDEVYFVLNSSYNTPKIEPTQKQILAMGRLEKQFI